MVELKEPTAKGQCSTANYNYSRQLLKDQILNPHRPPSCSMTPVFRLNVPPRLRGLVLPGLGSRITNHGYCRYII